MSLYPAQSWSGNLCCWLYYIKRYLNSSVTIIWRNSPLEGGPRSFDQPLTIKVVIFTAPILWLCIVWALYLITLFVYSTPIISRVAVVQDVGLEPLLHIPSVVCYHYTTSCIYLARLWDLNPYLRFWRPTFYQLNYHRICAQLGLCAHISSIFFSNISCSFLFIIETVAGSRGFEPLPSTLTVSRSTNWTNYPYWYWWPDLNGWLFAYQTNSLPTEIHQYMVWVSGIEPLKTSDL